MARTHWSAGSSGQSTTNQSANRTKQPSSDSSANDRAPSPGPVRAPWGSIRRPSLPQLELHAGPVTLRPDFWWGHIIWAAVSVVSGTLLYVLTALAVRGAGGTLGVATWSAMATTAVFAVGLHMYLTRHDLYRFHSQRYAATLRPLWLKLTHGEGLKS